MKIGGLKCWNLLGLYIGVLKRSNNVALKQRFYTGVSKLWPTGHTKNFVLIYLIFNLLKNYNKN